MKVKISDVYIPSQLVLSTDETEE